MDIKLEPLDHEQSVEGKKATFELEDDRESTINLYSGPEHRKYVRRINADRRKDMRFESETQRRSGRDKRAENKIWDCLHAK